MRVSFLRALSQRDFTVLWVGQTISLFGDGIFGVALAWQALESSGPGALGLVLVVLSAARVATLLFGGALADRYPKRFLMLAGDVLQMVSVGTLSFLVGAGTAELWHLASVAAATGVGSGIFLSSSTAFIPELVEEDHLESANALKSSGSLLAYDFVGPATGGVLVAVVGTETAFAVDAATFLASITALLFIRPRKAVENPERGSIVSDVREGLSYVRKTPWILVTLIAVGTFGNFATFGPLPVLVPIFVQQHLKEGADVLGIVFAGFGAGGILGAIVMGSRRVNTSTAVPMYLGWASSCIALGTLALAPNATVATICLAVAGFGGEMAEIMWSTVLQKLVPRHLLGRVTSTDWLVSLILQPVGVALAAPVAAWIGVTGAFAAGSAISTTALGAGLTSRKVRRLQSSSGAYESGNDSRIS